MSVKISALTSATTPLAGTEVVEIVQSGASRKVAVSYLAGSGVREKLSADRTYYVRTDGSDSNNGLANTSGGAFLTIQKAIDVVSSTLDIASGVIVTIQVADGTYTAANTLKPLVGAGVAVIKGNTTTPANVVVSVTGGVCFTCTSPGWYIRDLKVSTTTSGWCIYSSGPGVLTLGNLNFGASAHAHMLCDGGGKILIESNYAISGAALYHVYLERLSYFQINTQTITITGTPAFSVVFALASGLSEIYFPGCTFSGSATGKRYESTQNSVIYTNGGGANYFPGNSAGSTATGGQYA